jgi:hypothetical protein
MQSVPGRKYTYRKRSRRITGSRPAPAPVQPKSFITNDPHQSTAPEGLWVGLSLDLENVQRQQHNLTDSNDGACSCVHNSLAVTLAKCAVEASAVVRCQILPDEGLAAELVHSLEDLLLSDTGNALRTTTHTLYAAA